VDGDEGFYLQAGRSVADGMRLYTDFFYPQAPLYPHLLALLPGVGWDYWLQARFVSVFLSVLTMALVGLTVKSILRFTYDTKAPGFATNYHFAILLALALYSVSGFFMAWNFVTRAALDPQFAIVLFLSVAILVLARYHRADRFGYDLLSHYPLAVGVMIIGSLFMAYPTQRHYVTQGLPVLIVFVASQSDALVTWLNRSRPLFRKNALAVFSVIYLLGMAPYFWIYFTASRTRDQRNENSRVAEIVSIIQRHSSSDDTILAEAPIYAVLANRRQAPRAEFVGFEYKSMALGDRYATMNLADSAYIEHLITDRMVKLVVVENVPEAGLGRVLQDMYRKIYEDGFNQVWGLEPRQPTGD
jgi:hypothetical protein